MCVRKRIERCGEGAGLWRKTKAHWRGARCNSVYGVGCSTFAGEDRSLCFGPPVPSKVGGSFGDQSLGSPFSGYFFLQSTLPEHVLCVGHELGRMCGEQGRQNHCLHDVAPPHIFCLQDKGSHSFVHSLNERLFLVPDPAVSLKLIPSGSTT